VKYNNTAFSTINQTTTPDLRSNYITSVAVDGSNNRWLGVSAKGIAKLNSTDGWAANYDTINGIYGLNAGKKGNHAYEDLEFDSQGNLWIGGHTAYGALMVGALTKFNPATETGVSYATADGLVNEQIFSIAIDGNDDVWIATGAGLSKFHDAVGIIENNNNLSLDIFPNPAQDYLYINGSICSGIAQISDISGRIVSTEAVLAPAKLSIGNLDNGIYFIKVMDNDKNYSGKFIKE
jgi:ligand-binding sensor domain-containing protein